MKLDSTESQIPKIPDKKSPKETTQVQRKG